MSTATTPSSLPPASVAAKPAITRWGVFLLIARFIVGGLLIYASVSKIMAPPEAFLKAVRDYDLVPQGWPVLLNSIAVIVPWIEMVGGIILILGLNLSLSASVLRLTEHTKSINPAVTIRGAALVILLMLLGFTSAIGLRTQDDMQTNGTPFMEVEFDCGCGAGPDIIWIKLLENGALILLSMFILFSRSYGSSYPTPPTSAPLLPRPASPGND